MTSHEEVSWPLTLRQEIPNIHILIGHINVNKGLFCLIISYLQIKSYNVLNYNNSSTDWPFPLKSEFLLCRAFCRHIASCYGFSYYYRCSDIAINSVNPSFI